MKIREATVDDAARIYAVHASNDATDEWNDLAECREQIARLISLGTPPIVAASDGRILGEMKVWWGQDTPELGDSLDISTLYVHRDHQRSGVGGALIRRAAEISAQNDCRRVSVWADPDAIGFYRKQGFIPHLRVDHFLIDVTRVEEPDFPAEPASLRDLAPPPGRSLQTQRILHPRQRWHDLVAQEAEATPGKPTVYAYHLPSPGDRPPILAVYRLFYWQDNREKAELYIWCSDEDRLSALRSGTQLAGRIGLKILSIRAFGEMAEATATLGGDKQEDSQSVFVRENP